MAVPPWVRAWVLLVLDTLVLVVQVLAAMVNAVKEVVRPTAMREVRGEVAVVTGAGHGIGRCLALQLGELGVRVACWDLDGHAADEVEVTSYVAGYIHPDT